jgi:phosphatidylinositol glycan class S
MTDVDSSEAGPGPGTAQSAVVSLAKKTPPPERPESIRQRSLIILSFWAVVIFLGLPLWYKTTTIYRAKLPLGQMMEWAEGRVCAILEIPKWSFLY